MLNLEAAASLRSVNLRAEKAGDEIGDPAIDVSFACLLSASEARPLLSRADDVASFDRFCSGLWNDDGSLVMLGIKRVPFEFDMANVEAVLKPEFMDPLTLLDCKVGKVVAKPQANKTLEVGFRVQSHPRKGDLDVLSQLIGKDLIVVLDQKQMDLDV